jgi:hypothetical protein
MRILAAMTLAMAMAGGTAAGQTLIVHYSELPPLHYAGPQGKLTGYAAKPVTDALTAAGIAYEIRQTPAKFQLVLLQENREPACMMSWIDMLGRDRKGKFSDMIYQDKRPFALTWAGNRAMEDEKPLKDTLADPQLRLLVKDGFSYGGAIDRALLRYHTTISSIDGEAAQMLEVLRKRRVDYFFVSEEEATAAFKATGYPASDFKRIYFSDLTKGYERRLWCSKMVPDEVLKRFNAALAAQRK